MTVILISGSLIYRLRGVDPDGDPLQFGIRDQIGSDILRLEAISSNEANIYLVKELDREVSSLVCRGKLNFCIRKEIGTIKLNSSQKLTANDKLRLLVK